MTMSDSARALAHLRHEAFVVARTLGPQTGVGRGRDVVPERDVLGQLRQLGAVARFRAARPVANDGEKHVVARRLEAVVQPIELVQAQDSSPAPSCRWP